MLSHHPYLLHQYEFKFQQLQLTTQFPAAEPGKAAEVGPSALAPSIHMKDLDEAPGPCPAMMAIWGANQMEDPIESDSVPLAKQKLVFGQTLRVTRYLFSCVFMVSTAIDAYSLYLFIYIVLRENMFYFSPLPSLLTMFL